MNNFKLVQPRTETPATVDQLPGWMRLGVSRGLLIMDKNDEPKLSTAFWGLVILLIAVGILLYFLGRANGVEIGVEKGKEQKQLEQITNDLQQLKQSKSAEERMRENIKLANELTSNSNTEKK